MDARYNKIAGSLIGGAIGDALGYQIEFKRGIKDKEVTKFDGLGIISDDTQMTLFTANALLWRETRLHIRGIAMKPSDAVYFGYLDWLETQTGRKSNQPSISWILNVPELHASRAPGNTCMSALTSGKKGTLEEPINNSKGCGTVMRVAPVGLYAYDSESAGLTAAEVGAITHGHELANIPSYVLASMINLILNNNLDITDALNKSMDEVKKSDKFKKESINEFEILVNKALELSKQGINDIEAIKLLGEGWVADEAFAIALYSCLKYENSFVDAVVCAVNHDGDSDSTGAITGNIIGTLLGLESIPKYYIDNLELKDLILELAHDLSVDIPVNEFKPQEDDKEWLKKYCYCRINDKEQSHNN